MNASFHPLARAELHQAADWYEDRRAGLGAELTAAVEHAVKLVLGAPERWPRSHYDPRARRYLLLQFPFAVCYAVVGDVLFIVAIAHLRRSPGYWTRRLDDTEPPY